jgi:hypothetical protein
MERHINNKILINKSKMNKILILLFFCLFSIGGVNAVIDLGIVKQGECITLYQSCPTCTYSDVRAIKYPSGEINNSMDWEMTKNNSDYTYEFCDTETTGEYNYFVYGNKGGLTYEASEEGTFEVTPSGEKGLLGLSFILIGGVYIIAFVGFFWRNEWVSILGGMGLLILGVYMVGNGIDVYRNYMTNAFSYFTIALGCIFTMVPLYSILRENLG